MRKYLMTGVAALAIFAAFTSCSKGEELYDQGAIDQMATESITKTYNETFIKVFGQPSPNQDWGFGNTIAGTRAVFANGNEWAANDKDDCKYKVPPVLTADQIKIVRIYFQSVKDPIYQDPQWTDYFIQQVYKGGDNPGPNSTEKYKAADGNTYLTGSAHMDHLAAVNGDFVDHNNNFNHGDCGVYGNVLDFKGTLTTTEETYPVNDATHRHSDKINLMVGSTTASFGYYNSNSSLRRTEFTGLVSWSTIKTWADANGHAGEADCLNDGWNRSFMGFDFEMLIDNELYAKNDDGSIKYLTYGDLPDANYAWDGESTYGGARPASDEFVTDANGNKIPVLNSSTNMYAGTNGDIDQNQIITSHSCLSGYQYNQATQKNDLPYYQDQNCLNTKVLFNKVNSGYCLVDGSKGCKWVKIGGTADHYYSDWIVTLTKAEKYDTPTPPTHNYTICVIGEDLTVGGTDAEDAGADFDFNDVVFDVALETNATWVRLKAAGGTLPLTIDGVEVHGKFGVDTNVMVNTGAGPEKAWVEFQLPNIYTDAKAIPVKVTKGGRQVELKAVQGEPASKIGVKTSYVWCRERVGVVEQYPNFSKWVTSMYPGTIEWY